MSPRRAKRTFTSEYKSEAAALWRTTDKSVKQLAKELDLTPSALQRWITQSGIDAGEKEGGLTTDERAELVLLRRENHILREERDILKRATAFFAKEIR